MTLSATFAGKSNSPILNLRIRGSGSLISFPNRKLILKNNGHDFVGSTTELSKMLDDIRKGK